MRVLDDLSTGREENLRPFRERIDFVRGSVADRGVVEKAIADMDGIFHQAAIPSVPRSVANPVATHVSIVDGTLVLLEAMRRSGRGKMVMASSSSVYGETPELPKREEMATRPQSPYAVAKLTAEQYTLVYSRLFGVKTVALRYFNVFGPGQDPGSEYAAVIPRFITAVLDGRAPVIYGDGAQSRDFTYVANVVDANLKAMWSDVTGERFNIAGGEQVTLLELVAELSRILDRPIAPELAPERAGDIKHSFAAIERAREAFGYVPTIRFADGLRLTVEHLVAERQGRAR